MRRAGDEATREVYFEAKKYHPRGDEWTVFEQDAAMWMLRFLRSLPVEKRMEAMGMVKVSDISHPKCWVEPRG